MNKKSLKLNTNGKINVLEYLQKSNVFLVKSHGDIMSKVENKLNKGIYDMVSQNVIHVSIEISTDGLLYMNFLLNKEWTEPTKKFVTKNNIKYNYPYNVAELDIESIIHNFRNHPFVILFNENKKTYSLFNVLDESVVDVIKKAEKIIILK